MKALILSADQFEDSELRVPCERLRAGGVEVDIASLRIGTIAGKHGYHAQANKTLGQIIADDYDLLIIPGGKAPAALRKENDALQIVRSFFARHKPVAAICHGPQVLVSAGVMQNRRATCYRSVAQEIQRAGATYEDREVVVDGNLVTSRQPSDLDAFMREIMKSLSGPRHNN